MTKLKFFQELINSLFVKQKNDKPFSFFLDKKKQLTTKEYLHNVASAKGEVSALNHAELLISHCEQLNDKELTNFFELLRKNYEVDSENLLLAIQNYDYEKNSQNLVNLLKLSEPSRRDIFTRCNGITRGTIRLVNLRKRLIELIIKKPELKAVDYDLVYLFKNWFNRGFLILRPINWETPAHILEKIIAYEAVHEINSWDELRTRLAPKDRRCFAFFHPLIPDDPLIFVEVALCKDIPRSIQDIIKIDRQEIDADDANTAIFYSISNCHNGLLGISFGNFLIKKVAKNLKRELPDLNQFLTLSPIPGLMKWMEEYAPITFERCTDKNCSDEELMKKTIKYLTESDRDDGLPNDPVGRFHIGNGASLERINLNADLSEKGLSQSYGIMANYLYDLDVVEENHELFFKNKIVKISNEIKTLKKTYKN